jgi:glyoxylase I family protein
MANPDVRIGRIDHVLLLVNDASEAVPFYESIGLRVENRLAGYGMIELRAGASHVDLVDVGSAEGAWARPPIGGGRNADHVALTVDSHDAESLRRHLRALGIAIREERDEGATVSLYVEDPSGNTIELIAPT